MRIALGAGRARLVRQCLTESSVLGLSGGVLGILLAAIGIRPFVTFWPGSLPRAEEVQLDWRVLLFAITASLVSGILFGLAPALRAPAREMGQALLQLSSLDPGVNIRNVLTARTALSPATLANPAQTRAAWQDVMDRIRRVPGVEAVATVDTVPMREGSNPIGYATSAAAATE